MSYCNSKPVRKFLAFFCLLLSSCIKTDYYVDLSQTTKYDLLQFPSLAESATYKEIIWTQNEGVIAFIYDIENGYIENQPFAKEGDSTIGYLLLKQDPICTLRTTYLFPTLLPDGRLGFKELCETGTHSPPSLGPATSYLVAYDWRTKELQQILRQPLPHPYRSTCFSWNPQMTRAIQGTNDSLSGALYWLTPDGSEPLNLILYDGSRSWNMAKSYASLGNDKNDGIATCASWSPDADHIVFFATLKPIGLEGFARNNKPYDLYLYSFSTGKAESLLTGIYDPYNIQWSPDGKLIAFLGRMSDASRDDLDLWVFSPDTKRLFLIARGYFGHFVWSPDSQAIAIIWCQDLLCTNNKNTQIRKYLIKLP